MLNDRLVAIVRPKLPMVIRGYAESEIGKAVLANVFAAALVKYGVNHDKLLLAADSMVAAANDEVLGSFDFESMINEFLEGIDLPGATPVEGE